MCMYIQYISKVLERKTRPDAKLFIRPDASGRANDHGRTHAHRHGRRRACTDADEHAWTQTKMHGADARTKTQTHGRKRGRTDAHAAARDLTQTQANADVRAFHAWAGRWTIVQGPSRCTIYKCKNHSFE